MSSGVSRVMTGAGVGTGAALSIKTVGFRPRKVEIYNVTDPTSMVWINTMPDAAGYKDNDVGVWVASSTGITPLANGFTIGADTDLNVDGQIFYWVAYE